MSRCLICKEHFWQEVSLNIIFKPNKTQICSECSANLERTSGCIRCDKPTNKIRDRRYECSDCKKWRRVKGGDPLCKNRSIFLYNGFLKQLLADYKYRGDVALANVFTNDIRRIIRSEFPDFVVTALPLSPSRMQERGFNQAEQLLGMLSWHNCLTRSLSNDDKKQSKKTRAERIKREQNNPFSVMEHEFKQIKGKRYLIIDDIYTTGATVRLAAVQLIDAGAKNVSSLTIARS
ncbi:ComF family protein [Shouchella patagoniensis]|uniref:ComF family protein n=1 Tax=Shouchella patagoniensis TaxID=228576 RepID=UPI000994AE6E|nr:phosphoribosyltransferase family protein [Shouchella patagoniensis]